MVEKSTAMGDMYGQKGLMQKKVQGSGKYGSAVSQINTGAKATG